MHLVQSGIWMIIKRMQFNTLSSEKCIFQLKFVTHICRLRLDMKKRGLVSKKLWCCAGGGVVDEKLVLLINWCELKMKQPSLTFNRCLYAVYLKGKKTTRKSTCCTCCSWWCCKGGRGCAEVVCLQTDCTASCMQTCASCCPSRVPDITNFGVSQFSTDHPYVQRWYNVLQFTKGNIQ